MRLEMGIKQYVTMLSSGFNTVSKSYDCAAEVGVLMRVAVDIGIIGNIEYADQFDTVSSLHCNNFTAIMLVVIRS